MAPEPGLRGDWPTDPAHTSSVEEHLARVLGELTPADDFGQPLLECLGLACAEDVVSPMSLPRFDNSGMDGYAVRHDDVAGASGPAPVSLPVVGQIGAGRGDEVVSLPPGAAVKIMTGAPVPPGADSVVPYEWTDRAADTVSITQPPSPGQFVRRAGEDVELGDLLIEQGTVLGPRHLGLLAAVGRHLVRARPRPRVVVLSTGSELREPGQPLPRDGVHDANSFLLAAACRRAGAIAYRVGLVPDEPEAFLEALDDQLVRADVVVTSGGVSQGDFDVVKAALRSRGVWFGRVAMQPGGPQGFGLLGPDRVPVFTLPGNPVSAFVSFEVFVLPALRALMGMSPVSRPPMRARLTHDLTSPAGKRQYLRGELALADNGVHVTPVGGPGSHLIGELATANCLIVLDEDVTSVPAGSRVPTLPLDEEF